MITVHAQNFEDVYLWRALRHVENGRYVDVGAHDPDVDSVTRVFYEHGWRGINVEPVPHMYERLTERRPNDVCVRAACGEREAELSLYEVVNTGLSTLDGEQAERFRAEGLSVVEHKTPVTTLDTLLTSHGGDPVHFLKIDVEGAEAAVLAGCDFGRWRPWILVIEATAPRSQRLTSDAWEPMVLGAGFEKVYFDGLNNYYVADEHPEIKASFGLPPNVFDEFVLPLSHSLVSRAELDPLRQEVAQLSSELERTRALVLSLEELAEANEYWARSSEALLNTSSPGTPRRDRTTSGENEALRQVPHADARPVRSARSAVKNVARPVLDAGLRVVRRNDALRGGLRRVLHKFPATEARFSRYAAARPPESDS